MNAQAQEAWSNDISANVIEIKPMISSISGVLSDAAIQECGSIITTIKDQDLAAVCTEQINCYIGSSESGRIEFEHLAPITQLVIRLADYTASLKADITDKFKGQEILRTEIDSLKNGLKSSEHLITIYSTVLY